jgi:hypothetical protein
MEVLIEFDYIWRYAVRVNGQVVIVLSDDIDAINYAADLYYLGRTADVVQVIDLYYDELN